MIDISIIIVTYNSERDICACLDSVIAATSDLSTEVFVVDNASRDQTVEIVRDRYPSVVLLPQASNLGFPGANNEAIRLAVGRLVMLLNPDTVVHPGAFTEIVAFMAQHAECGVCGPELVDEDGCVYPNLWRPGLALELVHTFRLIGLLQRSFSDSRVEVVSGACLVARRSLFNQVGLLDDQMHSCEDTDFCIRARGAGHDVMIVRTARVTHIKGQSEKTNRSYVTTKQYSSRIRFYKKHAGVLERAVLFRLLRWQIILRVVKLQFVCLVSPSDDARAHLRTLAMVYQDLPAQIRQRVEQHTPAGGGA